MDRLNTELRFDLASTSLREMNQALHALSGDDSRSVTIVNPEGANNIAVGLNQPLTVEVHGHAGYYAAGMNKHASVLIHGSAGTGVAENMMSGKVHVKGFASNAAGASANGGLLVIEGDAGLRCGISLKGGDIVVGDALGDSLCEAVIYLKGNVKSLGADAREEEMSAKDHQVLGELLDRAGLAHDPKSFRRIASAKTLYHWNADANQEY